MADSAYVGAPSVLVPARSAGYLLVACRQVRLRERAAGLPPEARAELVAVLDALERAAREHQVPAPVALVRDDETPVTAPSAECTTSAAAARLGVSERRVQQWAQGGTLPGRKVGRSWLIDEQSVRLLTTERKGAVGMADNANDVPAGEGPHAVIVLENVAISPEVRAIVAETGFAVVDLAPGRVRIEAA